MSQMASPHLSGGRRAHVTHVMRSSSGPLCRSWLALRARYKWQHRAGAVLCLVSLLLLVATDGAAPQSTLR